MDIERLDRQVAMCQGRDYNFAEFKYGWTPALRTCWEQNNNIHVCGAASLTVKACRMDQVLDRYALWIPSDLSGFSHPNCVQSSQKIKHDYLKQWLV
jgi:hypothetical protein